MTKGNINRLEQTMRTMSRMIRLNPNAMDAALVILQAQRELGSVLEDLVLRPDANEGA